MVFLAWGGGIYWCINEARNGEGVGSLEMKLVDFDEVLDVFREKNRRISL